MGCDFYWFAVFFWFFSHLQLPYKDSWLITYDEILALWIWHKTTVGPYTVDQFLNILAFFNLFFQRTKLETVNLLTIYLCCQGKAWEVGQGFERLIKILQTESSLGAIAICHHNIALSQTLSHPLCFSLSLATLNQQRTPEIVTNAT